MYVYEEKFYFACVSPFPKLPKLSTKREILVCVSLLGKADSEVCIQYNVPV